MSKPPLIAPRFSTTTDADWAREIQLARARGERDGNQILASIFNKNKCCSGRSRFLSNAVSFNSGFV